MVSIMTEEQKPQGNKDTSVTIYGPVYSAWKRNGSGNLNRDINFALGQMCNLQGFEEIVLAISRKKGGDNEQ